MNQDLKKGVLPHDSAHSKLVKRGAATSLMLTALEKSREHAAGSSFLSQVNRLQKAGYPERNLVEIAESLISKLRKSVHKSKVIAQKKKKSGGYTVHS